MIDMFMLLTVGFVILFVLAFILIKPVVPKTQEVPLDEQLLIKLKWDDTMNVDLDLWMLDSQGLITSFKRKDNNGITLERDDLGHSNEWSMVDGSARPIFSNFEVIRIKNLADGDYYITVHYYAARGGYNTSPTPMNPSQPGFRLGEFKNTMEFQVTAWIPNKHTPIFVENDTVDYHKETSVIKFTVVDGKIKEMEPHNMQIALGNLRRGE